jgi:hypothetical protein
MKEKTKNLVFNAEEHRYFLDGIELPSVTTVLSAAGLYDLSMADPDALEAARVRGTNVHRICELWDNGKLDESSLDAGGAEYLEAWKAFRRDHKIADFHGVEMTIYSETYGYAGTLDRFWVRPTKRAVVIDIKTGAPSKQTGPQIAAYAKALALMRGQIGTNYDRWEVSLEPGKYKVREFLDARDWNIFLSCLNIYKYRKAA